MVDQKLERVEEMLKLELDKHEDMFGAASKGGHGRTKRSAWFPFIGSAFKTLFGTATEAEVNTYQEALGKMGIIVQNNSLIVSHTLRAIEKQTKSINDIISDMQNVDDEVMTLGGELQGMARIMNVVIVGQHLYDYVLSLITDYEQLISDVLTCVDGRVSPSLLHARDLKEVVTKVVNLTNLDPLVEVDKVHWIYPLLKCEVFHNSVFIHIPFAREGLYQLARVHEFPVLHNDSSLVPRIIRDRLVITSPDERFVAFPELGELDKCTRPGSGVWVCSPRDLLFKSISSLGGLERCTIAIVMNRSVSTSCEFQEVDPQDPIMLHVNHQIILNLRNKVNMVQVNCNLEKSRLMDLEGTYVFDGACSVVADTWRIKPLQIGNMLHKQLVVPEVLHISVNTSLPYEPMRKLNFSAQSIDTELESSEVLNEHLFDFVKHGKWSRDDVQTSVALSAGILIVIGIIVMIVCCACCKKATCVCVSHILSMCKGCTPATKNEERGRRQELEARDG